MRPTRTLKFVPILSILLIMSIKRTGLVASTAVLMRSDKRLSRRSRLHLRDPFREPLDGPLVDLTCRQRRHLAGAADRKPMQQHGRFRMARRNEPGVRQPVCLVLRPFVEKLAVGRANVVLQVHEGVAAAAFDMADPQLACR